jgi:hypothetical protein
MRGASARWKGEGSQGARDLPAQLAEDGGIPFVQVAADIAQIDKGAH